MIYQRIAVLDSPGPTNLPHFEGTDQEDKRGIPGSQNRSADPADGSRNYMPSTKTAHVPDDAEDISECTPSHSGSRQME